MLHGMSAGKMLAGNRCAGMLQVQELNSDHSAA
jgi:hypothetical protein